MIFQQQIKNNSKETELKNKCASLFLDVQFREQILKYLI